MCILGSVLPFWHGRGEGELGAGLWSVIPIHSLLHSIFCKHLPVLLFYENILQQDNTMFYLAKPVGLNNEIFKNLFGMKNNAIITYRCESPCLCFQEFLEARMFWGAGGCSWRKQDWWDGPGLLSSFFYSQMEGFPSERFNPAEHTSMIRAKEPPPWILTNSGLNVFANWNSDL